MSRTNKLVFRWVGKSLEGHAKRKRAVITHQQRQAYLGYLSDALDPQKGLFSQTPRDEVLGRVTSNESAQAESTWELKSTRPCLCFTELDLGDCADHWREFGRLAFGFTKQFLVEQGGGPMQYCLGTKDCERVRDLTLIQRVLMPKNKNSKKAGPDVLDAFARLAHFYKRLRPVIERRKSSASSGQGGKAKAKDQFRPEPLLEDSLATEARYGRLKGMKHLEEHEWRLVYSDGHERWLKILSEEQPAKAWFHIEAGSELQMVILPDNRSLQLVQQSTFFCERLFHIPKKPVQLISLEAIARS